MDNKMVYPVEQKNSEGAALLSESAVAHKSYLRWMSAFVFILPSIILITLFSLQSASTKIAERNTPLLISSLESQIELGVFHLWFEEMIQGDQTHTKESVWAHLEKVQMYALAMLEGGEIPAGQVLAIEDQGLRTKIQNFQKLAKNFSDIGEARLANSLQSRVGSSIDQRFDGVFLELLKVAESVKQTLKNKIDKQTQQYRLIILLLAGGVISVAFLIAYFFFRFEQKRLKVVHQLTNSQVRYQELCDNMRSCVAIYSVSKNGEDFVFVDFNRAAEKAENVKKEDLIGRQLTDVFPAVKEFGLFEVLKRVWKTGISEHHPITVYEDSRILGWRENYVYKLPSGDIVAVYDDLTEQKQAEFALQKSEKKFQTLTTVSPVGVFYTTPDGECSYVNERWCDLAGMTAEEAEGSGWLNAIHPEDKDEVFAKWYEAAQNKTLFKAEYRFRTPQEKNTWVVGQALAHMDGNGDVAGYVGTITDISERKELEAKLKELASIDDLTKLSNRREFENQLTQALARTARNSDMLAMLFVDLDGFKNINDQQGHEAGDQVLKAVAFRMTKLFRKSDTVGRIGGDEFTIIMEGKVTRDNTKKVVEKLLKELSNPYELSSGETANLSASIGVAFAPDNADNIKDLFAAADQAMYKAKERGKNRYVLAGDLD